MCGIVYMHNFDGSPVNNDIMQQFDLQRSRGVQGFGLYDGQEMNMVRATKEDSILKWLVKYDSNMILFHHRNPTSTINVKRAAHPFSTKDYFGDTQYVMVHNGHVSNSEELFVNHQELGMEYYSMLNDLTFNDSESLLWDLALTLEGKQPSLKATGGIAFICLKLVKGEIEKMYFGRNTSPLNMMRTKEGIKLSSEGEGEEIEPNTLYTYNYALNRLTHKPFIIKRYEYTTTQTTKNWNTSSLPYQSSWYGSRTRDWLDEKEVIDYDYNGDPIFTSYDDYMESSLVRQGVADVPTPEEVRSRAMTYLDNADGKLEEAYWYVEMDYDDMFEEGWAYSDDWRYEKTMLEKVMEYITNDPDYISGRQVSNAWRSVCQQNQLI